MPINLHIAPSGDEPIYRQIMDQVVQAIAAGALEAGEKLPSHRELAAELVVAPLTVKKAYDGLEQEAWVETRRGRGTFVCVGRGGAARDEQIGALEQQAEAFIRMASELGIPKTAQLKMLQEARSRLRAKASDQRRRSK